jgi:hypothetical protein
VLDQPNLIALGQLFTETDRFQQAAINEGGVLVRSRGNVEERIEYVHPINLPSYQR